MSARVRHRVLVNAGAGTIPGDDPAEVIRARFGARGVPVDVHVVHDGEDMVEAARRAVAERPDVLVAGGGDGTLNAVARAVVGSATTFGVLPLGTLNHFARDMGIPSDLDGAVDTVCAGHVRRVDVGYVNGRLFLNNSSLGMYPQMVLQRERIVQRLGHGKRFALLWAAWTVFRRHPFVEVRLNVDNRSVVVRTPVVFVGNNGYEVEGLHLGERRCLTAGHLDVHYVNHTSRAGLIALAARAVLGRLHDASDFTSICASTLEVQTRRTSPSVAIDGEVTRLHSPLAYRIEPLALPVLAPANGGS